MMRRKPTTTISSLAMRALRVEKLWSMIVRMELGRVCAFFWR